MMPRIRPIRPAVTQFAVIDALLAGAYESGLRVAEARSIGDFGLGCVDHLGGEVVIVDGEAIECTLDGPPVAMDDDDILPFAIVRRFPDVPRLGLGEQDFEGFAASVGYEGLESGFQDVVGIAFQLVVLVFIVGLLVVSRRAREPGTSATTYIRQKRPLGLSCRDTPPAP